MKRARREPLICRTPSEREEVKNFLPMTKTNNLWSSRNANLVAFSQDIFRRSGLGDPANRGRVEQGNRASKKSHHKKVLPL